MKKNSFIAFLLLFPFLASNAQLEVTNNGRVYAGRDYPLNDAVLTIGLPTGSSTYSNYSFGTLSFPDSSTPNSNTPYYYVGLLGRSTLWANFCNIGLQGIASNNTSSRNFGVLGGLGDTTSYGVGIFGTLNNHTGFSVTGRFAGYFDGDTYVDGTLTAANVVTPSDIRLKENIVSLSDEAPDGATLSSLMDVDVIHFNRTKRTVVLEEDIMEGKEKPREIVLNEGDTLRHYGFVAQQLQEIFPDVVRQGQDGYLGVNYIEMIPLLLRSIQELKQEVNEMKNKTNASEPVYTSASFNIADEKETAVLFQNTPNPFSSQTDIRFTLPDNTKNAYICIFDMQGKMLKQMAVNHTMRSLTINGYDLPAGLYLYSLIVNGQEVDTKRMILSK